ncbi:MAG: hypothetical protein AVO33_11445 [delta proteobacterium ML8_F1]|nr:MAG: hypothetical protein AVO33_11445 [delta proteobacterium ML8_F1]
MSKVRVGLVFGGESQEHEVSIMTAREVLGAMDPERYDIDLYGIDKGGAWHRMQGSLKGLESLEMTAKGKRIPGELVESLQQCDVLFPLLHGPYGEDGRIQGFFEMLGLPYVGSGVLGSAVAMDKEVARRLLMAGGIPMVEARVLRVHETVDCEALVQDLGLPLFIKPANLGSSIGITKAKSGEALAAGIAEAFKYDDKILVEKGHEVREIECGVLGNLDPVVSGPGEIIPSHEFYDYEAKYFDGGASKIVIPANLEEKEVQRIQFLALKAFRELELSGLARVDFFIDRVTGEIYLNEVNTIPGFTPFSMYPRLFVASGLSYSEVIERLVTLALKRGGTASEKQHD